MSSTRCAACKHLRRKCPSDCIFSPYFPSDNPDRFAYVHKIYGASNIAKMLQDLPVHVRGEAANTLYYEAYCRMKDPINGCVGEITCLHQQIYNAQTQLFTIKAEIEALRSNAQTQHQYQQEAERVPMYEENLLPMQEGVHNYHLSTWSFQNGL